MEDNFKAKMIQNCMLPNYEIIEFATQIRGGLDVEDCIVHFKSYGEAQYMFLSYKMQDKPTIEDIVYNIEKWDSYHQEMSLRRFSRPQCGYLVQSMVAKNYKIKDKIYKNNYESMLIDKMQDYVISICRKNSSLRTFKNIYEFVMENFYKDCIEEIN